MTAPVRTRAMAALSSNWMLNLLGFGTMIVLIIVGWAVFNTRGTVNAVDDGNAATTCRASYNGEVVDARTDLDIASSKLRRLNTETDNAQIAVTRDALFNDGANVLHLLQVLDAAGAAELDYTEVVAKLEDRYIAANDRYQAILDEARDDPDAFLVRCRGSH